MRMYCGRASRWMPTWRRWCWGICRARMPRLALHDGRDVDVTELHRQRAGVQARLDELASLFADGAIDGSQLRRASTELRSRLMVLDSQLADLARTNPVEDLLGAGGRLAEKWAAMSKDLQGRVVNELMTVTTLPAPRGRRAFDPEFIQIEWKTGLSAGATFPRYRPVGGPVDHMNSCPAATTWWWGAPVADPTTGEARRLINGPSTARLRRSAKKLNKQSPNTAGLAVRNTYGPDGLPPHSLHAYSLGHRGVLWGFPERLFTLLIFLSEVA